MDLVTLRDELHRLSVMTEGWSASHEIPEIERDLVLEKLRNLYDAVRFGLDPETSSEPSPQKASEEEPAVAIDFDAMIGLDTLLENPELAEQTESPLAEPIAAAESVSDSAAASEEQSSDVTAASEKNGEAESLTTDEPTGMPDNPEMPDVELQEESPVSIPDAGERSDDDPEAVSPIDAQSDDSDVAPEKPVGSAEEEPMPVADAAAPDAADEKTDTEIPADEQTRRVAAEPERHPDEDGALSLFDIDAVAVKRAKHRVVMALYGDNPLVEPKRNAAPEVVTEEKEELRSVVTAPAAASENRPEETVQYDAPESEPVSVPLPQEQQTAEPSSAEPEPVGVERTPDPVQESAAPVLGELLNADVRTVSDVIASTVSASVVGQEPVTDLHKALCNNDRFLLARDLFNGDMAECERTIDRLNEFEDLDECMIYIAENFDWNPNSDGAKLLVDLLERKLL